MDQVLVCDPRRNALLKEGSKTDKVDARKLAVGMGLVFRTRDEKLDRDVAVKIPLLGHFS